MDHNLEVMDQMQTRKAREMCEWIRCAPTRELAYSRFMASMFELGRRRFETGFYLDDDSASVSRTYECWRRKS